MTDTDIQTKICSTCKIEKPFSEFSKQKTSKFGIRSECKMCANAYEKERRKSGKKGLVESKNGLGTYLSNLRKRVKKNSKELTVTEEYLKSIPMPRYCPYLGLELKWFNYTSGNNDAAKASYRIDSASLDRIDSNKGYVEGNVRWVSSLFNKMKYTLSDQELKEYCKRILEAYEKEEQNAKLCIPMSQ